MDFVGEFLWEFYLSDDGLENPDTSPGTWSRVAEPEDAGANFAVFDSYSLGSTLIARYTSGGSLSDWSEKLLASEI